MPKKSEIKSEIFDHIAALLNDDQGQITDDTPLLGGPSPLSSMQIVELCLALDDKANDLNFEFDWKSEAAMSKSKSMFRTAGSLAEEFLSQMTAST